MICDFSPVAFQIFGFSIHWYSFAYIFGLLIAVKLTEFLAVRSEQSEHLMFARDFLNYAIIGIVVGGRLGHVLFYGLQYYTENYFEILKVWKGGMSFFGGFVGVVFVTYVYCRKQKIDFLRFIDLWAVSVPIGLFLGRIANFINGELLGKATYSPWYVIFADGVPRHPSQLYEAFLEGVLLFLIMIFAFYKKAHKYHGMLSGIFCVGYGVARIIGEFFREPDSLFSAELLHAYGINLNQLMSVGIILLGSALIYRSTKRCE